MIVRPEHPSEFAAIRSVIEQSFGQSNEAKLVEALRGVSGFDPELSLVAEVQGLIVGHILFSTITIESAAQSWDAVALAPLCVLPSHQNRGIGSRLVLHGLRKCAFLGHGIVVVVGEPGYYSRFGFERASRFGVRPPFELPDDAFMMIEIRAAALRGVSGMVRYSKPFDEL